jgi:hypothetical protein
MMKDGKYWLGWLNSRGQVENMMKVVRFSVENRFGTLPDIDDHISTGYAALAEAAISFNPVYTRDDGTEIVADGLHNFVRYALAKAIGEASASARTGGRWSDEAVAFTDMWSGDNDPWEILELIGVSHGFDGTDHEDAEEATWVTKSGHVMSTTEIIDKAVEYSAALSKKAGCREEDLPMLVLKALTEVDLGSEPTFTLDPPKKEPVTRSALDSVVIIRRARGGGEVTVTLNSEQHTLAVEAASGGYVWTDEETQPIDWEDRSRMMPWDIERKRINESWPETVTRGGMKAAIAAYKDGERNGDLAQMSTGIAVVARMLNVGVDWELLGLPSMVEDWDNGKEYTDHQARTVLSYVAGRIKISRNTLFAAFDVLPDGEYNADDEPVSKERVQKWIGAVMQNDRVGKLREGVERLVLRGVSVQAARA